MTESSPAATDLAGRPARTRPRRPRLRRSGRLALLAATLLLTTAAVGCSDGDAGAPGTPAAGPDVATATGGVSGPLCAALPTGTEPGNPDSLTGQPADVALGWIPVLTTFESAVRAAGLSERLRDPRGITILAPTDDAFARKFSQSDLDELLIHDRERLRGLLRAHLVEGSHPLADLVAAGSVTTMDGTRLVVTPAEPTARLGDTAHAVCADYRVAGGRIHLIDAVLGDLPTTAGQGDDPAH